MFNKVYKKNNKYKYKVLSYDFLLEKEIEQLNNNKIDK